MARKWRVVSTIGPWHQCSRNVFRFYLRENRKTGEKVYFADYRVDDLVSRHHELLPFDQGLNASFGIASQTAIGLTREALAEL